VGAAAAAGFVPIFAGWNVWDVWQADDPTFSIMNIGLDLDRELRIWVENEIKDNAPGAAVADPANPAALRGDQIQIIPHVNGLQSAATRGDIPELAGAMQIGSQGSKATLRTVRFWNRGSETSMPWAHDENYMLDQAYTPSSSNSATNAPQPSSLGATATTIAGDVGTGLKVVAIVGGVVLVGGVILALASASKKAAAA
jgi:hypothetical protein